MDNQFFKIINRISVETKICNFTKKNRYQFIISEMDRVCDGLKLVRGTVNGAFGNREPWQIAAITATTVLGSVYVWDVLSQDECKFNKIYLINIY